MTLSVSSESLPGESRSAAIIPFPARLKSAPVVATPEDRLARALASLNAALADQKAAVAAWRDVLGALKATASGLDESLQRHRSNLRSLGTSASALHAKVRSLEQWADGVAVPE